MLMHNIYFPELSLKGATFDAQHKSPRSLSNPDSPIIFHFHSAQESFLASHHPTPTPPSPPGQLETDQRKLCLRLQIPVLSVQCLSRQSVLSFQRPGQVRAL